MLFAHQKLGKNCFALRKYKELVGFNLRDYHSYPDPNEKPKIQLSTASSLKTLDKSKYFLKESFKLDLQFPGTPISKGITKENPPVTESSRLANDLTVASQEMPGLMTSFAFLVKTGRFFIFLIRIS